MLSPWNFPVPCHIRHSSVLVIPCVLCFADSSIGSIFCFLCPVSLTSCLRFKPILLAIYWIYLYDDTLWIIPTQSSICSIPNFSSPGYYFDSWPRHIWLQVKVRDFTIIFSFFLFFFYYLHTIRYSIFLGLPMKYILNIFLFFFFAVFYFMSLPPMLKSHMVSLTLFPLIHFWYCFQSSEHSRIIPFSCQNFYQVHLFSCVACKS